MNNPGSYQCTCKDGYELIGDECENINECTPLISRPGTETWQDPCLSKPHSTCKDTIGSFECECDSGYGRNEVEDECLDIDECEQNSHACPENSECSNFYG